MLRSAALTAFLATANPERAKAFYRETLGLRLLTDDQFALAFDANGTELRIQKVEKLKPHPFTSLGWHVPDIAQAVTDLLKQGVSFERYEFMKQDKLGVWKAPSGAKVAWFKDPDGNLLSLTEHR
jgi:catechol 2,3-dioxygenase-like lactoylglutathione lyase family enzyme